ncbi:Glycosyltransferase involved in cell wall bisynthesis [Rubrivivax sp. A210]|uniref:glycosyltransferase family 4 protein n=1 Tax=Rubrivivax sp. A210 TaxID=2772301 RepID=UPI0019194028|nr:glycosyltransferase family 4 protein [Rubrivivax sp. A210]CAD5375219.1 Glycosyltransferase involved in cell wall bisynthesis [Rubrivivax sp. A210]
MKILTFSTLYPSSLMPLNAVFVRRRMEACARLCGHELTVVAPVPYFPRLPFKTAAAWDTFARVPAHESPWGYEIYHPRYLVTPKLGMRFYGRWMAAATMALVRRLHEQRRFDVIDAHYVYPDGEAAVALGAALGLPVVLSSRGTDLNLYPTLPAIRPRIVDTLERARHLVCVCDELRQVALGLGQPEAKVSVIGNGIDPEMFSPGDRQAARNRLGLPAQATLMLSVGHLTERKGFHILIESLVRLGASAPQGQALKLVIVGGGPQRQELDELVARLGLAERVVFAGAVPQEALPQWYAACDLFLLASSREGWPNVLCEAQAMGLPIVASRAWGIPEIVRHAGLGLLVADRSAAAFADGIRQALHTDWDRQAIAREGAVRTWPVVAREVDGVLRRAVT